MHSSHLAADNKTKEVYFTYNAPNNTVYAIFPVYPDDRKLVLKRMKLPSGTKLFFPSLNKDLQWQQNGEDVIVSLPEYNPNTIKAPYAYVIKISNYGKFAHKPHST